jgi:hypothetical protein
MPKLGSFDGTQSRKVNIIGAALPALGTDGQPVVTMIHADIADTGTLQRSIETLSVLHNANLD